MHNTYYLPSPDNDSYLPYIHIGEFARRLGLNHTTVLSLLSEDGKQKGEIGGTRWRRALKHIRDDSTVFIPLSELADYPFIKGSNCYHYIPSPEGWKREFCLECTMGGGCERVKGVEELEQKS